MQAVIVVQPGSARRRVAGLWLLDRLVMAAHRAGCDKVTLVSRESLPRLCRAEASRVPVEWVADMPRWREPVLLLSSHVFAQADDLKRLMDVGGRLVTSRGDSLPVARIDEGVGEDWRQTLETLPARVALEAALAVKDETSALNAGRLFWASMASSADGMVDRWLNRPLGRPLAKALVGTPVTPNQVSALSTLIGLAAAVALAWGTRVSTLCGAFLLQFSAVIDCVDGDLARAAFKESPLGKWLDIVGDQVVHVAVFVSIGLGLWRMGSHSPVLELAAIAGLGVVLSFAVVLRGLSRPGSLKNIPLQRLIDATTNRDFSVLLIALALAGKVEWFLWMAAVGVHLFWMTALLLQLKGESLGTRSMTTRHEKGA